MALAHQSVTNFISLGSYRGRCSRGTSNRGSAVSESGNVASWPAFKVIFQVLKGAAIFSIGRSGGEAWIEECRGRSTSAASGFGVGPGSARAVAGSVAIAVWRSRTGGSVPWSSPCRERTGVRQMSPRWVKPPKDPRLCPCIRATEDSGGGSGQSQVAQGGGWAGPVSMSIDGSTSAVAFLDGISAVAKEVSVRWMPSICQIWLSSNSRRWVWSRTLARTTMSRSPVTRVRLVPLGWPSTAA